jgi:hypothetical protein
LSSGLSQKYTDHKVYKNRQHILARKEITQAFAKILAIYQYKRQETEEMQKWLRKMS